MSDDVKLLYADETYAIRGSAFEVYKEMGTPSTKVCTKNAWSWR